MFTLPGKKMAPLLLRRALPVWSGSGSSEDGSLTSGRVAFAFVSVRGCQLHRFSFVSVC